MNKIMADEHDPRKRRDSMRRKEENAGGFGCSHCRSWVPINEIMGTSNRNHCPSCLWSKHLDEKSPGDRMSSCGNGMKPIGLTFKAEGTNRYGENKQGELMLIHDCQGCHKISINRIAADDQLEVILKVFENSLELSQHEKNALSSQAIRLLTSEDLEEIRRQLIGKI